MQNGGQQRRGYGLNIYKDGEEPKILADEEYPEWLREMALPPPTLEGG
jgi:hypothetical protein